MKEIKYNENNEIIIIIKWNENERKWKKMKMK